MVIKTTTYQPGQNINDIQKKYKIENVIKLASNENPLGPSTKAVKAGLKIFKIINRYPDSKSINLKNVIKNFLSKSFITSDNIMVGNGSNEILEFIARRYLTRGSEALFCKHSFLVYKIISQNANAKIVESKPISTSGDEYLSIDLKDLRSRVTSKTKVIFIANPSNPTGTILKFAVLSKFIDSIPKRIIIVIDEAYYEYSEFQGFKSLINLLNKHPNLVITRSFSKIHALAGLRIGYGLASKKITNHFNDFRQPFNINYVAQEMAAASLEDKVYIEKSLRKNQIGMNYLKLNFDKLGVSYLNSYTNFVTINLGLSTKKVYKALLSKGVILRPLDNYGLPKYLRVTIGTDRENKFFINTLTSILRSLK